VTSKDIGSQLDVALAKQALHELNMAYARAADRADAALMASIFHDDATVVTGLVNGTAADYAVKITSFVRENLERAFHSVANEWYEVRGDRAVGECYVIANATADGTDTLSGGRYIDAYERRNGVWKIASRTFVLDWSQAQPTSYESGGMYASLTTRGCFGKDDPIYAFWNA
jgi:ketosteroid isomerase-like protein